MCRRFSNGMESIVSHQGGFDDVYPSDEIISVYNDDDNEQPHEQCLVEATSDQAFLEYETHGYTLPGLYQ